MLQFKTRLDHRSLEEREEREGVFIRVCFFPLKMAIHDGIFMDGSW